MLKECKKRKKKKRKEKKDNQNSTCMIDLIDEGIDILMNRLKRQRR